MFLNSLMKEFSQRNILKMVNGLYGEAEENLNQQQSLSNHLKMGMILIGVGFILYYCCLNHKYLYSTDNIEFLKPQDIIGERLEKIKEFVHITVKQDTDQQVLFDFRKT